MPKSTGFKIDLYYDSPEWRILRQKVLNRDKETCKYCGGLARQADHVIPRKLGGKDHLRNLVACCHHCNKTALNHRFRTFADKKKYILQHRGLVVIEKAPPKEKPKENARLLRNPPYRGLLRTKLANKNKPQHYREELLQNSQS